VSQFQTLQFSMTLDRWRRERERDQLYAGADGGLRPLPLGRGSAWRPPTTSYWVVMREKLSNSLYGAAWMGSNTLYTLLNLFY
jgi:hypothetical protein